jgi:hypothetical protein
MRDMRNAYVFFVGEAVGRRPLGRCSRRWEDNIKLDIKYIRFEDVDWINFAQDMGHLRALVNTLLNPDVSQMSDSQLVQKEIPPWY